MFCSLVSFGQFPDMMFPSILPVSEVSGSPFQDLEKQLKSGKVIALRDVGTFLDEKNDDSNTAFRLLQKYTIFSPLEINLKQQPSRKEWMNFYYENEKAIRFSGLLNAFYLKPVEKQTSDHELKKLKYSLSGSRFHFSKDLFNPNVSSKIVLTETKRLIEAVKFSHDPREFWPQKKKLIALSRKHLTKKNPILVDKISELLTYFRDEKDFKQIVALSKMGLLSGKSAIKHLAFLSNQNLYTLNVPEDATIDRYNIVLDSLGSLAKMVEQGYKIHFNFTKAHFIEEVDYYGRILSESHLFPFVQHNVLRDLVGTHNPVALFYIASQCYAQRFEPHQAIWTQNDYLNFLEKLTYTKVGVKTSKGKIEFEKPIWNDPDGLRNFLIYWANQNDEFIWNEDLKIFENYILVNEERSVYEVALQQLNSKDEKEAFAGLNKLVHGEAEIVIPLLSRYKDLLKSTHPQLPNLKGEVLPTLILMNDYCELENIPTKLPPKLKTELDLLNEVENPKQRFEQENKIISLVSFEDITAIELWAISQNNHIENSLSADRIINNYYSNFWCQISENSNQLSLFLKKMTLLGEFHNYLSNTHLDICSIEPMVPLVNDEDSDIIRSLIRVRAKECFQKNPKELFPKMELITEASINDLPAPSPEMIPMILKAMKQPKSPKHKHLLIGYFNRHIKAEHRNMLLELLKSGETQEWIVLLLEQLYQIETPHKTDKEQQQFWLSNWKSAGKDPDKLGERLWQLQFDELAKQQKISATEVSLLSNSPYLNKKKAKLLLPLLQRFEPINEIWKINFTQRLDALESLKYFKNIPFPEAYYKTFPTFFEVEERPLVIDFLIEKSKNIEQGVIFNDLVSEEWFLDLLELNLFSNNAIKSLEEILNKYYDESSWLTEMEEMNIEINLFNIANRGKTSVEKLEASIKTNITAQAKSAIQLKLLSRVSYEELGEVLKLWPQLSQMPELKSYNFVSKDFGIPFFEMEDETARENLIQKLTTTKPIEVYSSYLKEFGVPFLKGKKPDLVAIRSILKNDLNVPFSGNGGVVRDNYVFGLLKYLEYYYNDDLGFHPKLNENQNYYQFNSRKRVAMWLEKIGKE